MTDTTSQESGDWPAAGPGPATTSQSQAPPEAHATLAGRIRRSFLASVGSIVFGMEDGTVSIFGLVFGVAASAPDSRAVLLAGGTGAVAAAVSMMAGTFLDVESTNDQAAARVADARARYEADPGLQDSDVHRRLVTAGLSDTEAATVAGIVGKHPETSLKLAAGLDLGTDQPARQSPVVQSVWMFFTDLFAAAVPVVPFALFTLAAARLVSLSVTLVLLVLLGVGRSMIGRRRLLPTVAETIGIAAAAAFAGLAIGKLIS
jgi:VIT1/CCC1 family predicted Fe2+/Mn2+ transporter